MNGPRIKPGVKIAGMQPEAVIGMQFAMGVYLAHGFMFRLTSGIEGKHKSTSLHYLGKAFDCGITHLAEDTWELLAAEIAASLGAEFDVVLERDPPHIHVEWDPKPVKVA